MLQDGRFLLLETLGRGAMGAVYRAYDRVEQRLVALKVPSEAWDSGPAHPFAAEFATWFQLSHPNIVRVYELALARSGPLPEGTPYLVLEHVDGGPVHRVLRPGCLDDPLTESVAVQLLRALEHVHAHGIVHRDVKPGNVLVRLAGPRQPAVRLTDFGLAAPVGVCRDPGVFSGSLPFVAPEALIGLPLDGRADLYGLGILLYHLVTGRMPVEIGGAAELLRWHLGGPPADPTRLRPGTSARLARFVRRLTARDREERPPTAGAALHLLAAAAEAPAAWSRRSPPCKPGERAQLRLALDAARLGAARVHELPREAGSAAALLWEVAVWTQVRGLGFHRIPSTAGLARLVLRLVLERGAAGAAAVRDYGLAHWLPLECLGDLPVLDGERSRSVPRERALRAAASIAAFLLHCARERSIVLALPPTDGADRLVRALVRVLIDAVRHPPAAGAAGADCRGLLLLTRAPRRARPGRISPRPSRARLRPLDGGPDPPGSAA